MGTRCIGQIRAYPTTTNLPQHKEVIAENTVLKLGMVPTVTHAYQPGRSRTSEALPPARPLPALGITYCLLGATLSPQLPLTTRKLLCATVTVSLLIRKEDRKMEWRPVLGLVTLCLALTGSLPGPLLQDPSLCQRLLQSSASIPSFHCP